jgi:hypothetical protein
VRSSFTLIRNNTRLSSYLTAISKYRDYTRILSDDGVINGYGGTNGMEMAGET